MMNEAKTTFKRLKILALAMTLGSTFYSCSKDEEPEEPDNGNQTEEPITVKDYDGNIYDPVEIGTQTWLKQNLSVTHFNDGTTIPTDISDLDWHNTSEPGMSANPANQTLFGDLGNLYNWFAISSDKGICPDGYRIPTDEDFKALIDYIGGTENGGDLKAKNGHWSELGGTNKGATNTTNFSALPAGLRLVDGQFSEYARRGEFWTLTDSGNEAISHYLLENSAIAFWQKVSKNQGASCRCIKK